jgi:UDP-N-acetylmuramoylalanine--D-glutamate ligase
VGTAARPPLSGGPYLVLGLARSGEAIAHVLNKRGATVIGVDGGRTPALEAAGRRLSAEGVEVHLDASEHALPNGVTTLVKSPGVPQSAPLIKAALDAGIEIAGELELAWRLLPNDFIAVTGTNGKTTTAEWIGHIYRTAGEPVAVAGNVGTALSTLVDEFDPQATVVCEASSFQLEDTVAFAPDAAVLLNITPDHLDRHGTFDAYRAAKLKIFANQTAQDLAVLPVGFELETRARQVRFGDPGLLPTPSVSLPGAHNLQNAMAASALALARGIDREAVAEGLRTFRGVAHRLELVGERGGVRYVNDSKATNVASTIVALESYPSGVHLILGGQGKGQDFRQLAPLVAQRCVAVYLIGEDAQLIGAALADTGVPLRPVEVLSVAVDIAGKQASNGEVVLLSPACASYDQFDDFEQRGDAFRALVEA